MWDSPYYYESPRDRYERPRRYYDRYNDFYRDRYYDDDDDYYDRPRRRRQESAEVRSGGPRPYIAPKAPQTVALPNNEEPGTVIIDTTARRLYYVISSNAAYSYPISVGREGFSWTGTEKVSRIAAWPDWYPPAEMREREPHLPKKMLGGLRNPLGAKAIYLGNTLYRIHGTNDAKSIGRAASSGCFRMMNAHVLHLASLINVGTTVKVVKSWQAARGVVSAGPGGAPS
jgi:lipoprotein-anchoring transpeptidase ErfK/SrfK